MTSTEATVGADASVCVDVAARPGRRRDPGLDNAILDAALALFAEGGYRGVTIEGVAARAGVGKATVYRRHATAAALLVEAARIRLCLLHDLPDTGDLRADLVNLLEPLVARLRGPEGPTMRAFMVERSREPELAAEWERSVIGRKREHVRMLIAAAIERGELAADTDIELVAEIPAAIVWHHALNALPVTDDLVERAVHHALAPYVLATT